MAGGLKVGDLYIIATASVGKALTSLGQLVKAAEETAKAVKEATEPVGQIGAVVAAGIGAAVAAAAKSNASLQASITVLTDLLYTLAADIGDLFAPTVRKVSEYLSKLVATFQRLSPEVKRAGANIAVWIAGAGLAIGTTGKLAGVVEGSAKAVGLLVTVLKGLSTSSALAGVATGFTSAAVGLRRIADMKPAALMKSIGTGAADAAKGMGGLTGSLSSVVSGLRFTAAYFAYFAAPVAAIALAVAGIALLAGSLYGAWKDTSTGLKDSVTTILTSIATLAAKIWDVLAKLFEGITAVIAVLVVEALERFAWLIRQTAKMMGPLAKAMNMGNLARVLKSAEGLTGEDLFNAGKQVGGAAFDSITKGASSLKSSISDALSTGWKEGKDFVTYGFSHSWEGLKQAVQDSGLLGLTDLLKGLLNGPKLSDEPPEIRFADGLDKELEYFEKVIAALNARAAEESRLEYERSVAAEEMRINLQLEAQKLVEAAAKKMKDARETLVSGLSAAFGRIKDLVEAFQTGTEASGSAWGGLAAVVAQLLTESKGFLDLITMVTNIVQRVADGLGELLVPMQPLIGALGYIVDVLMNALEPLLNYVGQALSYIAPPLVLVGKLLEGLAPLMNALMPPLDILEEAMKALFEVLKFVATVVLMVAKLIGHVWNAVISAIQAVVRALSKAVEWLGIKALKNFATSMEKMKVNTDQMGTSMRNLRDTTWESADAQARQTAEVLKGTTALEKMTEALTNVPDAWRIAYRRYQNQDTAEGPGMPPLPGDDGGSGRPSGPALAQWYLDYMELPDEVRERIERRSPEPYIGRDVPSGDEYGTRARTIGGQQKGATYNLTVNTVDEAAGVDRAIRFVKRMDYLTKMADSGRRISKSSRWGG